MSDTPAATSAAPSGGPLDVNTALDLFSIAGSLNSTLDLDFLLQKIGIAAEKLLDSEASAIMLVTDDKKSLYFKVASGEKSKALKTMTLPIGKGIGGWVAQHRKPEVVNDCRSDPRFAGQFDKTSGFVTRSLLCVPMVFRGELVGVVEVLNKRQGTYSPEHIGLLTSLASLASVAITNAKIVAEQKNFFSHILELLCVVIETAKSNMDEHPSRAAKLACAMGRALGLEEYDYRMLYYAGILHDVGYIAFKNQAFLNDNGILSVSEEIHPALSAKMLEGIKMIEGAIPMIRHHHERFDGTGFPARLKGGDIPLGARILGLVESVEELYMMGLRGEDLHAAALRDTKARSGTTFDPKVVDAFAEVLSSQAELWA